MYDVKKSLSQFGLSGLGPIHANLLPEALSEEALKRGEVQKSADGALVAKTGVHTGRSPNDKFVVRDATTEKTIHWGPVNQPIEPAKFDALFERIAEWLKGRDVFVQDLYAGAPAAHRIPIRIIGTNAWHSLFARNMFIRPQPGQAVDEPDFTVVHVPEFTADPARDGTRSGTFIIINFTKKIVLVGGTSYAGEVKKSIFSIMNYILPAKNVLPMHASANNGAPSGKRLGDVTIFFGLSGTGKTTLSADASRKLIGDDEHGWADDGVFNFEGGCYAKAIRLSAKMEPEIYAAARRPGTVLENVVLKPDGTPDFDDASLAENSRACYPIDFIPNASLDGIGGLPRNVVMLTCDAYGVLPPISKLSTEQAMYHFLSGYTARVAGTEKGVTEPQATFSTCFGAPFLPRPPEVYSDLLGQKITRHKVHCWLVNTGWSGGGAGVGKRMPIDVTRALVRAAISGELAQGKFVHAPAFGLSIPESCAGVPAELLNPRAMWTDKAAYDAQAAKVTGLFRDNFKKFADRVSPEVRAAGF
ncbi:MAG: phosphoenolpyruvate carboxykinase (ATP) [Alphaproteobacteria bacterium]|nr:phosphoenolpyruvate carboxykinase (ATP) [Alphaproteobacteria bacterium]